jgi:O-antigen/teichoic acid export membrane protein
MTALKRLVGSTAIYAMANVINSAIPFLLLPVLTRVLAPEEYGVVAMFTTVMAVLSAVTGLSMHGAVSVRYFNSQTNHPRFLGSCLVLLSCSTSIVLAFMWVMGGIFSEWVGLPEKWLLLAVLASSFQTLIYIRLVMWQVKGQAVRYGFFQVIQTLVNLGVSLWLIIIADLGWEGRVLGIFVALSVFGVLAVFSLWLKDLMQLSFDRKYIRA